MSINELLNDLKETYSFSSVTCSQKPGDAMTDFVFYLTQDQITKVIEKASRLNSIVESWATTLRCVGANELHIRTCDSMIKMLIQSLFD